MTNDIKDILKKLDIQDTGRYENHFYIIDIEDSDTWAKWYSKLETCAVSAEYPNFGKNSNNNTIKIINYFELDLKGITYNIFLIADLTNDKYFCKIGERPANDN